MKIAVLVAGAYRGHAAAVKTWNFLKAFDCDVFFSTWDHRQVANLTFPLLVEDVLDLHPTATVNVLNETEVGMPNNSSKMIWLWRDAHSAMLKRGNAYDIVLLIRPDLRVDTLVPMLKAEFASVAENSLSMLYCPQGHADDTLLFGCQDAMSKLILGLDPLTAVATWRIHKWLSDKISEFGLTTRLTRGFVRPGIHRNSLIRPHEYESNRNRVRTDTSVLGKTVAQ